MTLDVEKVAKELVGYLGTADFKPRDSDGNDLQYGDDMTLRFKVGTVYGEVAVTVWKDGRQVEALRILSEKQVPEAKHRLDRIIYNHQRTEPMVEVKGEAGEVLAEGADPIAPIPEDEPWAWTGKEKSQRPVPPPEVPDMPVEPPTEKPAAGGKA